MSGGTAMMHSSEHQPLAIRARPDLSYHRQTYQGQPWWLVKDPVALRYYRIRPEACEVLRMLDGQRSLQQLKTEIEDRFPMLNVKISDLHSMIGMLHRYGLVLAQASGRGPQLYQRMTEQRLRRVLGQLSSILWIRLPGVDPERFLNWLYPKTRWFFSVWSVAGCVTLMVSAWLLVLLHFHEFYAKLPSFHQFFGAGNLVWMMLALAVAKILHEIGHGLTCKHYGGECHEIGVMFLVLTPCLYCDTSDAWILPNKWHRAAIGAAGMYVEVVLASICTFVWWNTEPGLVHYLALNTVFICSLSTVIFNSNPLLRYDGYYILSDILEIPNLAQKSRSALIGLLRHWCLGLAWNKDQVLPPRQRMTFALYAMASFCYRWFILFVILLFLSRFLEPYGLQPLAHLIIASSLVGLIVVPTWKAIQFFRVPGRILQLNKRRTLSTTILLLGVSLAVMYIPLPHRVITPVIIEPRGAERIYVNVAGVLETVTVEEGEAVSAGQELAVLTNPEIRFQITQLSGERERLEQHLQNLRRQQSGDADATQQIPHTQEGLVHLRKRLEELHKEQQRLNLVSQTSGIVMPPPYNSGNTQTRLPAWYGTPLEERNLGCWLEPGTLFCVIGDATQMQATLVVDQSNINFVRLGQVVEIKLDEFPSDVWPGEITEISRMDLQVLPRELSHMAGGELATEADETGAQRPASVSYQAFVALDNSDERLLPGFRGRAKIHVGKRTLGEALWRFLTKTFRLR